MTRIGSLFSGYGGLDMAVQSVIGGHLAWYSEIEPAACNVLTAHHPGVPNLGDITAVDWATVPTIDVLTGGYPCQPFSHAGKRKGTNDERHLWPYVCDAIRILRPRYTILENVRGHLTLGFDSVLADVAELGMSVRWGVVRASDAGAPHGRARLFIIITDPADTDSQGPQGRFIRAAGVGRQEPRGTAGGCGVELSANTDSGRRVESLQQSSDIGATDRTGPSTVPSGHSADAVVALRFGALASADAAVGDSSVAVRGHRRCDTGLGEAQFRGSNIGASTDSDCDGFGQQLHAAGMGGVESKAESSPRQRQRSRRQPDAGSDLAVADSASRKHGVSGVGIPDAARRNETNWGKYGPAINRWEHTINRTAPAPTTSGKSGRPRLNPAFVEWMMGLPDGHVTGHGLSAAKELKMLGNGVVPQQAALALRMLGVTP